MARARCNVMVSDHTGVCFEHNFYYLVPTYFLAREPTQDEKHALTQEIVARYTRRALEMASFTCVACKVPAVDLVCMPMFALHDPGALAINNHCFSVCGAQTCKKDADEKMAVVRQHMMARVGAEMWNPEVVSCGNCFKRFGKPLQRCGRCRSTAYCSRDCQKAHWKCHKQGCNGRIEAAKLTAHELAQLDEYARCYTNGSMELEHLNHYGTFPEKQEQAGRGTALTAEGPEMAEIRNRVQRKRSRKNKKKAEKAAQGPEEDNLHYTDTEPCMDLEGARLDVLMYFQH